MSAIEGVALYRHDTFPNQVDWHEDVLESWDEDPKPYRAFPESFAVALVAVVESARALRTCWGDPDRYEEAELDFFAALGRIDRINT